MKMAVWAAAILLAMAAVLGGFWYGMVHAKNAQLQVAPPAASRPSGHATGSP